jgi:type II secretory pathway pseudopilin PulG
MNHVSLHHITSAPVCRDRSRGFSVFEIMISVIVLVIITSIIFVSFTNFRDRELLRRDTRSVTALIKEAHALTLAARNDLQYGVHFEVGKAVLYPGTTYVPSSAENKEVLLSPLVSISLITLNTGGSNTLFQRLTGKTDGHGTVELSLITEPTRKRTITIGRTGVVESN